MNPADDRQSISAHVSAAAQACRPMADYLFDDAPGKQPSTEQLQAAKRALMPLRGHAGPIGSAVTVLLEGGSSKAAYDEAISVLFRTARGGDATGAE